MTKVTPGTGVGVGVGDGVGTGVNVGVGVGVGAGVGVGVGGGVGGGRKQYVDPHPSTGQYSQYSPLYLTDSLRRHPKYAVLK